MQPEPSAVSQHALPLDSSPAEPLDRLQYGNDGCRDQVSGPFSLPQHEEAGDHRPSVFPVSESEGQSPLRRVSSDRSAQSSPSVDRISQYEQSCMSSPRKHGEIGFVVVSSSGKSRLSFEAFPNGMSTLCTLCSSLD